MKKKGFVKKGIKKNKKGTTLIESLTVLFIFSLITVTFYSVISTGTRYIQDSKNRLAGMTVANAKMETIRNLPYDKIGVEGSDVEGSIPANQDVLESGNTFKVKTFVEYVFDSHDGLYYPEDEAPNDYKKVTIQVFWGNGESDGNKVEMTSFFVPPGLEIPTPGEGIMLVNVVSDQLGGSPVAGAKVRVINSETGLNMEKITPASGSVFFAGERVKESINKYEITVSKDGYETVYTQAPYPETAFNPYLVHGSVLAGTLNVINVITNPLAGLRVLTEDHLGNAVPGIDFEIVGGRKLGVEVDYPFEGVWELSEEEETNSSGIKDFGLMSPGEYFFQLIGEDASNYEVIDWKPQKPFFLASLAGSVDLILKIASKNETSLLVKVVRDEDGDPFLPGASVRLIGPSYDEEVFANSEGKAFFPVSADVFLPGSYELRVNMTGFSENFSSFEIFDGQMREETVKMNF